MRRTLGALSAGVVLTLIAFVFDASPLFVVGVALTLLALVSFGWVLTAARGAGIERDELPARAIEGQPVIAPIRLRRGPLGLPGASVIDSLQSDEFRNPRRGVHLVAPPVLRIADPLGLAAVNKRGPGGQRQVLVLPRTEPVNWGTTGGALLRAGRAPMPAEPVASVEVDGLRPYRPGTPASRIHWPALARGAGLLERRLHADGEELPLVVLDTRGDVEPDLVDAAVRAAASLILELALAGGARALLPGARRPESIAPDLIAWHQLHARLAVVPGGPTVSAPALDGQRAGTARFYVAAGGSRFAPAGVVLVVPAALAPSAAGASFEVGGCVGYAPVAARHRGAA